MGTVAEGTHVEVKQDVILRLETLTVRETKVHSQADICLEDITIRCMVPSPALPCIKKHAVSNVEGQHRRLFLLSFDQKHVHCMQRGTRLCIAQTAMCDAVYHVSGFYRNCGGICSTIR